MLVVEDDDTLSRLFRTTLSLAGFDVRTAGDGIQALREIDSAPPDLVVLDIGLPHISGLGVRQEIAAHARTRDIPIVIVTGSAMPLEDANARCVLRKPIHLNQLVDAVRCCLAEPPAATS